MRCRQCGTEFKEGIFCPECGTRYTEDVKIEKKDREKAVQKNDQITFEEKYETGEMINRTNHLIKYHSFWKYLFLSFITCGSYGIYVFWGVVNDINEICNKDGKKSPNYILVLLLSLLTCGIYGLYWWYIQGERLYKAAEKYGIDVREKGSTMLLWQILNCTFMPGIGALVAVYIMFDNMNQIALVYNGEKKREELLMMKRPHPHLIRNVFVLYGIIVVIIILILKNIPESVEISEEKKSVENIKVEDFSNMDFEELIESPEEDLEKIGLKKSSNHLEYEALDGSIQVGCENGKVETILLKGKSKKLPSFYNVKNGMNIEIVRQKLADFYPEERRGEKENEILFIDLNTGKSVTCTVIDERVNMMMYEKLSEDVIDKYNVDKEKNEENVDKKVKSEITGDMMQDVENGMLFASVEGTIVDINGEPIAQYADCFVTEEGGISDGFAVLEGFIVSNKEGKIIFQQPEEIEAMTPGETALALEESVESYDPREAVRRKDENAGRRIQIYGSVNEMDGKFYVPIGDGVSAMALNDCKVFDEEGIATRIIGGDYIHVIGIFNASYTTDDLGYKYYSMSDCYVIIQNSFF